MRLRILVFSFLCLIVEPNAYGERNAVVTNLAFSPNGRFLMVSKDDWSQRVMDVSERRYLSSVRFGERTPSIGLTHIRQLFSGDGSLLVTAHVDGFLQANLNPNGQLTNRRNIDDSGFFVGALSRDGRRLASIKDMNHVDIWALPSWDSIARIPLEQFLHGPRQPRSLRVNEYVDVAFVDGSRELLIALDNGQLVRWNIARSQVTRRIPVARSSPAGGMLSIIFSYVSPSGDYVIGRSINGALSFLQVGESAREIASVPLRELTHPVPSFDGRFLGVRYRDGTVELWETASGTMLRSLALPVVPWYGETTFAFSPTGTAFAVAGNGEFPQVIADYDPLKIASRRFNALSAERSRALWADLTARDARSAYTAMTELVSGRDTAVAVIEAGMLGWGVPTGEELRQARRWAIELDSEVYAIRHRAHLNLRALGERALSVLTESLRNVRSLEHRRRLEDCLKYCEELTRPGEWTAEGGEQRRLLRAIAVLEHIRTPGARNLLTRLGERAPDSRLRRLADEALSRTVERLE